jgi:hypothetical protein
MSRASDQKDVVDQWQWEPALADLLRYPFTGAATITRNHSQAFQDIFVLSMLDGMTHGRYLEIGAHHPVSNNNTHLLHKSYEWSGVSIDIDVTHLAGWRKERPRSTLLIADALKINYHEVFPSWFNAEPSPSASAKTKWFQREKTPPPPHDPHRIDYLQLDIEPSIHTLDVLNALPLDSYRFSVITFETDAYAGDFRARDQSRECLSKRGYELIAADVSVLYTPVSNEPIPFEDWWVDPQVVSQDKILAFRSAGREGGGGCPPQRLLFSR